MTIDKSEEKENKKLLFQERKSFTQLKMRKENFKLARTVKCTLLDIYP